MTPEEFTARATAAVATVEPDEASYAWLTRNVARRRTRRRVLWAAAATAAVAVTGVAVAVVPRERDSGVTTTPTGGPSPTASAKPSPAIDGDVDGDGAADTVELMAKGNGLDTTWGVRVRLSSGATVMNWRPPGAESNDGHEITGVVDANRDGRAEIVVLAGTTVSEVRHYMLTLVGTDLLWVHQGGDPEPFPLTSGGDPNVTSYGWRCADEDPLTPEFEIVTVEVRTDGPRHVGIRRWYGLYGDSVMRVGGDSETWDSPALGSPGYETEVLCGSIR